MVLLTQAELDWVRAAYPKLNPNDDNTELRGEITFRAAYDAASAHFSIVRPNAAEPPGLILAGAYDVLIKDVVKMEKGRWLFSRLYIQDQAFPFCAERHFYLGKAACLCGPSEEVAYLKNGYFFQQYLEELCIPFLYGQLYYDLHTQWPWPYYDHDTLGVLQSYYVKGNLESLQFTLWWSLNGRATWPQMRAILSSKKRPKGHMPCFCEKAAPIRDCHPEAWEGLKKLYADVLAGNVALPPLDS
jgi:hypothetical protein